MKNGLWLGLASAIILSILWQFKPLPDALHRMETLPLIGIGYKGSDLPLKPSEKKIFEGVNVLKRVYTIGNKPFFITVLDGTHNRHVVHDPYYCLKGSGWSLLNEKTVPAPKGKASLLIVRKGDKEKEALFWFSDGNKQFNSPLTYWLTATLRRITLGLSGPEPVLIVVQPMQEEPVDWEHFQKQMGPLFNL